MVTFTNTINRTPITRHITTIEVDYLIRLSLNRGNNILATAFLRSNNGSNTWIRLREGGILHVQLTPEEYRYLLDNVDEAIELLQEVFDFTTLVVSNTDIPLVKYTPPDLFFMKQV